LRKELSDLLNRLRELEGRLFALESAPKGSDSSSEIEEIIKRLKDLESYVKSKLDCDVFEDEIASLRDLIASLGSNTSGGAPVQAPPPKREPGNSLSTKDLNRIKELLEKFPLLEESQAKIQK